VRNMLALANRGRVRNLVILEPVDPALIGEDKQVIVGGGHEEVLDEVFRARAHADAALAAAGLPAIGINGRALEVSAVGYRDGDVFDGDQVFEADFTGVLDDLGTALVPE